MKSQRMTNTITVTPEGNITVCTKLHGKSYVRMKSLFFYPIFPTLAYILQRLSFPLTK